MKKVVKNFFFDVSDIAEWGNLMEKLISYLLKLFSFATQAHFLRKLARKYEAKEIFVI